MLKQSWDCGVTLEFMYHRVEAVMGCGVRLEFLYHRVEAVMGLWCEARVHVSSC